MLIGLTGGIASGKSTVAGMLAERGAVIVDADRLARDVVAPGTLGLQRITERFGTSVITENGALNRTALGHIVFDDETARHDLNAIVHPAVREAAARRFREAATADPNAIIVYDVPLLAETDAADQFDLVVVADAPAAVRQHRLVHLRGVSPDDAAKRIAAQASDEERRRIADVVINTEGSFEATRAEVDRLWGRIITSSNT